MHVRLRCHAAGLNLFEAKPPLLAVDIEEFTLTEFRIPMLFEQGGVPFRVRKRRGDVVEHHQMVAMGTEVLRQHLGEQSRQPCVVGEHCGPRNDVPRFLQWREHLFKALRKEGGLLW